MNLKNDNGMSLVSALIASAIIAGSSLLLIEMMSFSQKASKGISASLEISTMHNQMLDHLRSQENCDETFAGLLAADPDGTEKYTLLPGGAPPAMSVAEQYISSGNYTTGTGMTDAPVDYRVNRVGSPVRLVSIQGLNPIHTANRDVNFGGYSYNIDAGTTLEEAMKYDLSPRGWSIIVEFEYSKFAPVPGEVRRSLGGSTIKKYARFTFNNFANVRYETVLANCLTTGAGTEVLVSGKDYITTNTKTSIMAAAPMGFFLCGDANPAGTIVANLRNPDIATGNDVPSGCVLD